MDKVTDARKCWILIKIPAACTAFCIGAFEYAHFIGKITVFKGQHSADSGSEIGRVRLKLTCTQCVLKALAVLYKVVNSIRLIAVCNYNFIFKRAYR